MTDAMTPTSHLDDDTLVKMLAGPLKGADLSDQFWEDHLSTCPLCRERLDALAGTMGAIGILQPVGGFQEIDAVVADLMATSASWLTAIAGRPALAPIHEEEIRTLLNSNDPNRLGKLGGLTVLEIIGQGGMGIVLKGFDRELNREVAIKLLHPAYRESESVRDRFLREARAIAALTHENVIPIHLVAEDDGLLYFVMPLAEGSLSDWLKSDSPPDEEERLRIAIAAARGLAAAHDEGIVHRDIKPANLLLHAATNTEGPCTLWLADFGLARRQDENQGESGADGTPGYVAPEIQAGEDGDERSDLYSLGVLFETLFPEGEPDRPSELIRRLMSINPSNRPANAVEVVSILEAKLNQKLESAATERFKRRLIRVAVTAAAVIGLPLIGLLGSDLLLGTGWTNAIQATFHDETVFTIKGRIGIHHSLWKLLNSAKDGDIIEVIGKEPVEVPPLILKGRSITLRAADRSASKGRPVLKLAPDSLDSLIWIDRGSLKIEGLELVHEVDRSARRPGTSLSPLIRIGGGNLEIVNSRIARTGSPADLSPLLILSRQNAPMIRIIDSELEDTNGTGIARASFKPAPEEEVLIENCRILCRRWIIVDPPSEPELAVGAPSSSIHFDIRDTWVRSDSAITLGNSAAPGRISIRMEWKDCRIETSGPAVVTSLSDFDTLRGVISIRDQGSTLSVGHKNLVRLAAGSPVPTDSTSHEAQWRD
ncbi:MAG: serine/threonine protein kinase, partial [Verrucomicrobiae bacterium]|nr:serine/threonine protein kinase [Verrucomicrobiae bacterium]